MRPVHLWNRPTRSEVAHIVGQRNPLKDVTGTLRSVRSGNKARYRVPMALAPQGHSPIHASAVHFPMLRTSYKRPTTHVRLRTGSVCGGAQERRELLSCPRRIHAILQGNTANLAASKCTTAVCKDGTVYVSESCYGQ